MPAVRPNNFWLARVLQAASCDSGRAQSGYRKAPRQAEVARIAKLHTASAANSAR